VELTGADTASGTGMLYACYGVHADSYIVSGKYSEDYVRVDGSWLFKTMDLALYFSVPLAHGWAGPKRHFLVNSGQKVPSTTPCCLTRPFRRTRRIPRIDNRKRNYSHD